MSITTMRRLNFVAAVLCGAATLLGAAVGDMGTVLLCGILCVANTWYTLFLPRG